MLASTPYTHVLSIKRLGYTHRFWASHHQTLQDNLLLAGKCSLLIVSYNHQTNPPSLTLQVPSWDFVNLDLFAKDVANHHQSDLL